MKKYKNLIWEGRFSPVHNGHLSTIEQMALQCECLWIIVVENKIGDVNKSPVPFFTEVVNKHHFPQKNIFPLWLRVQMLQKAVRDRFPSQFIVVSFGPRLDLAWNFYKEILPRKRTFAVPYRDDFDNLKETAWTTLGEEVCRIQCVEPSPISATQVRSYLSENRSLDVLLPGGIEKMIRKFLDNEE
ncbi:adenylyltransferase/cytidyltransferase family protein [Candidatus Haliotispira prima]|uniref:Adenylyltransferase/cytidyltransferase family protein n=1 Tax=Candidatus Haliotispira prima TaxID=3034016 RepID=A0ABY8MF51_9SPIO|nr:adenylyltransferase/cytidyltransferase family protein [Candidatus Haliotispira prima]